MYPYSEVGDCARPNDGPAAAIAPWPVSMGCTFRSRSRFAEGPRSRALGGSSRKNDEGPARGRSGRRFASPWIACMRVTSDAVGESGTELSYATRPSSAGNDRGAVGGYECPRLLGRLSMVEGSNVSEMTSGHSCTVVDVGDAVNPSTYAFVSTCASSLIEFAGHRSLAALCLTNDICIAPLR